MEDGLEQVHLGFLHDIQDWSVMGDGQGYVTPRIEFYDTKAEKRQAMTCLEDWYRYEGVHLNPALSSLKAARPQRSTVLLSNEEMEVNRVVLLDFDIFNKDGSPKVGVDPTLTPQKIVDECARLEVPLPYCYTLSQTPGNFHVVWVLNWFIRRMFCPTFKNLAEAWGADPRYTNSLSRNPLHPKFETHWWPEWADQPSYLCFPEDLLPEVRVVGEGEIRQKTIQGVSKTQRNGDVTPSSSKFKMGLSIKQLEEVMRTAEEGDGRWQMLRSWVLRAIFTYFKKNGCSPTSEDISDVAHEGNALFAEPMTRARVESIINYWTQKRVDALINRTCLSIENNITAKAAHEGAVVRYFEALDKRSIINEHLKDPSADLPPELAELDSTFKGVRLSKNKMVTKAYMSYMLGFSPYEKEDSSVVTPEMQMRSMFSNGSKYTREEYEEILYRQAHGDSLLAQWEYLNSK